jgi:peptidoglycan/LPS O-acetylase OafA/YrhL
MLDILRGLASLAVVLGHYQHFYVIAPGKLAHGFTKSSLPLYSLFWPFYEHAAMAVHMFYVLSGFVFYFIYCDAIRNKKVSAYNFAILRFSRLYPLHFITLIFVTIMQIAALSSMGNFFIFQINDVRHFLLNLFFAQNWGLEYGLSFNGPTWSVSVEILLYAVFFALAFAAGRSVAAAFAAMLSGLFMSKLLYGYGYGSFSAIGYGLFCFFAGGICFLAWERFRCRSGPLPLLVGLMTLALSAVGFSYTRTAHNTLSDAFLYGGCFPSVVFLLAAIQSIRHNTGRSLKVIGDITYATYLLHFPIQLVVVYVAACYGIMISYGDPSTLLIFLSGVIALSVLTYYFFERPAQSFFRRHLIPAVKKPVETAERQSEAA